MSKTLYFFSFWAGKIKFTHFTSVSYMEGWFSTPNKQIISQNINVKNTKIDNNFSFIHNSFQ